ncbi:unnamed protein product [Hymenolepis diminuta]|uniref:Uncharacterized protein n=1 Tax=Hymenolepis diminuta TaxID=6216 RepID=A0A564Y103_HYMDI|nr:unnamed protein product [Hymenolepis diminuta]
MRMFVEGKAMLLHYQQYHCSSDAMIKKEFQCPISDCFKLCKRQGCLKRHTSECYP